jgi:hypothetical protein
VVDAVALPVFPVIWLLIMVFGEFSAATTCRVGGKALWTIFVIVLPFLGILVYLIARGHKMQEHALEAAQAQNKAMRQYVQSVTSNGCAADEIARLATPRDHGVLSEAEFQQAKARALA